MKDGRILHVSGNIYPKLPADHHTKKIWESLAVGFSEYHVVARSDGNDFSCSIHKNIYLHLMPRLLKRSWVFFFSSWLLGLYVRKIKPTYIVVQCPVIGGLAAVFYSRVFRIPILVEIHGAHYFFPVGKSVGAKLKHWFFRLFSGVSFKYATKIRTLSLDMNNHLRSVYGEDAYAKAVIIPTRVDMSLFPTPKTNYEITDSLKIVTIGALSETKNHRSLIYDLSKLTVPWELTVIGEGNLRSQCETLAASLYPDNRVRLVGTLSRQKLAKALKESDVYIHYSLSEGLSRAILEAMAAGLPVISTDVGFINGVLTDKKNSLLLKGVWSEELINAVGFLLRSDQVRREMGEEARKTVLKNFEANTVFESYRKALGA